MNRCDHRKSLHRLRAWVRLMTVAAWLGVLAPLFTLATTLAAQSDLGPDAFGVSTVYICGHDQVPLSSPQANLPHCPSCIMATTAPLILPAQQSDHLASITTEVLPWPIMLVASPSFPPAQVSPPLRGPPFTV